MRSLVIVAALAATALAQPAIEQAKAHFKQARKLQDAGQFARAADEYKAAYELDPRPEMLFNIAQAYRLGGDKPAAIDYYQRYLDAQPKGAGADEARVHLVELGAKPREVEARIAPPPVIDTPAPPPIVAPAPPADKPTPPIEAPRQSSPALRIAGLATAGVGAIALGAGVKFGLDARSAADAISHHTGAWTDTEKARFDDGQRANRNMIIAYAGGGALVATGAILYIVGGRSHVVPVVGATSAGAMLWGRF